MHLDSKMLRGTKNYSVLACDLPKTKTTGGISYPRKVPYRGLLAADIFNSKVRARVPVVKNTGFSNLEASLLLRIFSYFTEKELSASLCRVCRHWYGVARNPSLWKELEFKAEKMETYGVCNILWKSSNLEKLSLIDMKNPATVIRQMCRCNRTLRHIKIKNCRSGQSEKIPETVLRNILYSCRNLESLNLKGTQFSSTRFYHELANLPRLRKLNLSKNKYLQAKDLMTIALNCRNLEDISVTRAQSGLNSVRITDQDAVFFFKNLSSSLRRVDFDVTGLTAPVFQAILSCPYLEHLSLRHALFLTGETFRDHVSLLRGLKQLRITQACQLVSEDFVVVSKKNVFDHLNLIDLSGCTRISDVGLRCVLQRCKEKLTYLGLKSCKSMKDLNFIINNCSKLQYLNIAHAFTPDALCIKNLPVKIPKLSKLVIDTRLLSKQDLTKLHTRVPKLTLIRSMSEFHKDESPVY